MWIGVAYWSVCVLVGWVVVSVDLGPDRHIGD